MISIKVGRIGWLAVFCIGSSIILSAADVRQPSESISSESYPSGEASPKELTGVGFSPELVTVLADESISSAEKEAAVRVLVDMINTGNPECLTYFESQAKRFMNDAFYAAENRDEYYYITILEALVEIRSAKLIQVLTQPEGVRMLWFGACGLIPMKPVKNVQRMLASLVRQGNSAVIQEIVMRASCPIDYTSADPFHCPRGRYDYESIDEPSNVLKFLGALKSTFDLMDGFNNRYAFDKEGYVSSFLKIIRFYSEERELLVRLHEKIASLVEIPMAGVLSVPKEELNYILGLLESLRIISWASIHRGGAIRTKGMVFCDYRLTGIDRYRVAKEFFVDAPLSGLIDRLEARFVLFE